MSSPPPPRWTRALLPFAAAYFLSYLYRTANTVVGPVLRDELALSAGGIGLLTAAYFLAFGLAQLPLGVLLDRYGARRVEAVLLLLAAAGAATFATARSAAGLAGGRALVGLGVSACLMGAFKAFSRLYPAERQASLTGWIMTSGALGAITSAYPMEAALRVTGWREIYVGLAVATLAASAFLFLRAPDEGRGEGAPETLAAQWAGVRTVFRSAHVWRALPLAVTFTGGFMAVQGLWATSWLMHVNGYPRAVAARHLTDMNVAMLAGYLVIGVVATPLARRGIGAARLVGAGVPLAVATLLLVALEATSHTRVLWTAFGAFSCFGTLLYAATARNFPVALAGRANTALNVAVFFGAFGLQWGIGALVDVLRARGLDPAGAHRVAFWVLVALQGIACAVFVAARRRAPARRLADEPLDGRTAPR